MIVGIGMDLVEIKKIARSIRSGVYLRKVFTEAEIADCRSVKNAAERFAGKFAAKESFMKAIGQGIRQGIWFTQIEVLHHDTGKPYLKTSGEAEKVLRKLKTESIHLSITHAGGMAAAVVILER